MLGMYIYLSYIFYEDVLVFISVLGIPWIFTVVLESLIVSLYFAIRHNGFPKKYLLDVFIINTVTNLILNTLLFVLIIVWDISRSAWYTTVAIGELCVLFIEAGYYYLCWRKHFFESLLISFVANATSLGLGIFLLKYFL